MREEGYMGRGEGVLKRVSQCLLRRAEIKLRWSTSSPLEIQAVGQMRLERATQREAWLEERRRGWRAGGRVCAGRTGRGRRQSAFLTPVRIARSTPLSLRRLYIAQAPANLAFPLPGYSCFDSIPRLVPSAVQLSSSADLAHVYARPVPFEHSSNAPTPLVNLRHP